MNTPLPATALQLRSLIRQSGELEISLAEVPVPMPAADEVLVRIEATPMNPSDLGLLFGAGDLSAARYSGSASQPVVTAPVPAAGMAAMAGRMDQSLAVGNEGAGVVVRAGSGAAAQALLGRTVAVMGGSMYAQYRTAKAADCLVLRDGQTAVQGASCFINPMTALGMVETLRHEGHSALVHTVGASNLGQMLNRLCLKEGIGLVNIVRKPEQEALLRSQGAQHVCNSGAPDFVQRLGEAVAATGATLAFDAIGGGALAGQILQAMEAAILRRATAGYSRYGSSVHKQIYIYGGLDRRPIELPRNVGMAWGVGGWLVFPYLEKLGLPRVQALRERVVAELTTTFASHYTCEVSLAGALQPEAIADYRRQATGAKYLIRPQLAG